MKNNGIYFHNGRNICSAAENKISRYFVQIFKETSKYLLLLLSFWGFFQASIPMQPCDPDIIDAIIINASYAYLKSLNSKTDKRPFQSF